VLQEIVNNFVNDRSSSEVMAVGSVQLLHLGMWCVWLQRGFVDHLVAKTDLVVCQFQCSWWPGNTSSWHEI